MTNMTYQNKYLNAIFKGPICCKSIIVLLPVVGFISLWNIPHTIAVRYIFSACALIIVIGYKPAWRLFFRDAGILLVFASYLLFQLVLFSTDLKLALANFSSEWMKFLIFSAIGAGTGLLAYQLNLKKLLLYLGAAFAAPLIIHISMFTSKAIEEGVIPWSFTGLHESHGDLGYAALNASILLASFLFFQAKNRYERILTVVLLFICIVSPLFASSRGGTSFVLLSIIVVSLVFLSVKNRIGAISNLQKFGFLFGLPILVLVTLTVGSFADSRWSPRLVSKLLIGFEGDPIKINCEGIPALRQAIEGRGQVITPDLEDLMESVNAADGSRTMTARAGVALSIRNPMGLNGSRDGYQIAISRICAPQIHMSHTHNGWLDTALAIGIPGAVLYLFVLLNYLKIGVNSLKFDSPAKGYAVALFTMSGIWIIRAMFDSTQRDQMLEMQAFTLALLLGIIACSREAVRKAGIESTSKH